MDSTAKITINAAVMSIMVKDLRLLRLFDEYVDDGVKLRESRHIPHELYPY